MKVTVYWITNNRGIRDRIRHRFGIPHYTSVNGETEAEIDDTDMELLKETEKRGFIQIRNK